MDTWDDKQTGQKRSKLRVVGETMQLLGGRPRWRRPKPSEESRQSAQQATPPPKSAAAAEPDEDEIPF